jgi:hypothetical protein
MWKGPIVCRLHRLPSLYIIERISYIINILQLFDTIRSIETELGQILNPTASSMRYIKPNSTQYDIYSNTELCNKMVVISRLISL